jgi:hypothetical protein
VPWYPFTQMVSSCSLLLLVITENRYLLFGSPEKS